ncbi:MAG TPA: response regulator [Rhodanobacter sp.]|jgi:Response regulators consisting of a CheY-like receiver domain and a winged-helix DNA-binding domain
MTTAAADKPCILLAEDEMLVAMMLEDFFQRSGYTVLKAARLVDCLKLAASAPLDLALLDINLAGQLSFPVALVLQGREIPFLFSSGYGDDGLPEAWKDEKVLQKPYDTKQLMAALNILRPA